MKYEHLHRYMVALAWAREKVVADVASGEGYGAALLSDVAAKVVGVDISSDCSRYAEQRYKKRKNLSFVTGSCEALPLRNHSIDLVTSFETLEHLERQEEMLDEIKRVLKPDGLLLLSSPNRMVYSDGTRPPNPYHVRELNWDELNDLLSQRFSQVAYYGQRMATGSFVFPLNGSPPADHYMAYNSDGDAAGSGVPCLGGSMYFLAVCGNRSIPFVPNADASVFIDRNTDLYAEHQRVGQWANRLARELENLSGKLAVAQDELARIKASTGWKLVCRAKEVLHRVAPPVTRRRDIFNAGMQLARWLVSESHKAKGVGRWLHQCRGLQMVRSVSRVFQRAFNIWRHAGTSALIARAIQKLRRLVGRPVRKRKQVYSVAKTWTALEFQPSNAPLVSIVIPVHNHALVTFTCLKSLVEADASVPFEVIVVDDGSNDETLRMLREMKGIRVLSTETNQGFIRACNAGARIAYGRYLVFLNNDTIVLPNWLDELLKTFELVPEAGLVGAKLIYPDGRLQEAGGIVWNDGSGWNYGRYDDPDKPEYNYLRAVDYCSGACIMLPRELFSLVGMFDERYAPAYGEDSDLAFKVREAGKKVLYQPKAEVIHFEGISSGTNTSSGSVKRHQVINKENLFKKWASVLVQHAAPGENPELERERGVSKRVLIVDACTPTPDQDAGSLKIYNFIKILQSLSYQVTFFPDNLAFLEGYTDDLQRRGVQCLYWPYVRSIVDHLKREGDKYDVILSCRPDVTERHLASYRKYCRAAKVLYDTADIHYLREQRQAEIEGDMFLARQAEQRKAQELGLVRRVDCTIVVSELEKQILQKDAGCGTFAVISAVHELHPRCVGFHETKDIFFLGGYQHLPNVDAVQYFVKDVFPLVRAQLPGVIFHIVGSRPPDSVQRLASEDVIVTGYLPDIGSLVSRCRLSVNPLRYGAGIKGKIVSCMAYGVPCVGTSVAFEGMGLQHGKDVLIADSPEDFASAVASLYDDEALWAQLSERGYSIVQNHYSFDTARKSYADLFSDLGVSARTRPRPATFYGTCNICGQKTHFKTLGSNNLRESLLCEVCGSSCRNRSLASGLLHIMGQGTVQSIAELATAPSGPRILDTDSFSPIFKFLKSADFYTGSIYMPDRPNGDVLGPKTLNVDLQSMPFPDESFDIILTSDVMEHVRRDDLAHREIFRCLKPGGHYVFTVPYVPGWQANQIRVDSSGSEDVFLMEKQYHGDPVNREGILVYRIYGQELLVQLQRLGFTVTFLDIPEPEKGILTKDLFICRKS